MNAQDFAYWLQGFVELTQGQTPNPAQWKSICEHLDLVFKKVTPPVGETKVKIDVDTKDAQKAVSDLTEAMRLYRELTKPAPSWPLTGHGYTVTCWRPRCSKPPNLYLVTRSRGIAERSASIYLRMSWPHVGQRLCSVDSATLSARVTVDGERLNCFAAA
jgi:hypothetical protein